MEVPTKINYDKFKKIVNYLTNETCYNDNKMSLDYKYFRNGLIICLIILIQTLLYFYYKLQQQKKKLKEAKNENINNFIDLKSIEKTQEYLHVKNKYIVTGYSEHNKKKIAKIIHNPILKQIVYKER